MSNLELLELWQFLEEQGLLPCVLINGITPAVHANKTLACVRHSTQALAVTWGTFCSRATQAQAVPHQWENIFPCEFWGCQDPHPAPHVPSPGSDEILGFLFEELPTLCVGMDSAQGLQVFLSAPPLSPGSAVTVSVTLQKTGMKARK